jgi:hypothetical protein
VTRRAVSARRCITLQIEYFRPFLLDEDWSSGEGIYPDRPAQVMALFDVLKVCLGHEYQLKRTNWRTQQSVLSKIILDAVKKRVCLLVDSSSGCSSRNYPCSCRIFAPRWGWPCRLGDYARVTRSVRRQAARQLCHQGLWRSEGIAPTSEACGWVHSR